MSTNISIDEVKDACQNDLHFLCTQMMHFEDWDTVHDEGELFLARPSKKKALVWPRGHLKTSMITIGKSMQHILRNPNIRILIANQIWDKAREMLSVIEAFLNDKSDLPKIFGKFVSDSWNKDSFIVKQRTKAFKEPTVSTTGVEAETTGGHYDVIFLDDLMGFQNSQTPDQREKVKRFRRSMIDLLEPDGIIYEVGTRWHLDDTFGEILEKEKDYYDISIRQIVEKKKILYPKKFQKKFDAKTKTWVAVDYPCMDFINYLKASKTPAEFAAQYMNNPIDDETQIIKPAYFKYWTQRPPRLYVGMTLDPAISEKQAADYFAIVVAGMDENYNIYLLDRLRGHWKVSEQIDNIFAMYDKWHPSVIGLEVIAYQKALKSWLEEKMRQRNVYFPITELKRNTNETKEFRIKALEPFYREGKIFHASWMKDGDLEEELVRYPKGNRHDDLIDAEASLLEVLVPGDTATLEQMPEGCWEAAFTEAQKFNQPGRDFFHEVLGDRGRAVQGKSFWDRTNP